VRVFIHQLEAHDENKNKVILALTSVLHKNGDREETINLAANSGGAGQKF